MYDLILKEAEMVFWSEKKGKIVTETHDIALKDGKIVGIGFFKGAKTLKTKGLHVLPGLIDTQVHFREPGHPDKEDMESGTLSALKGGITSVLEMPNTSPSTTTKEALRDKVKRTQNRIWCHIGFFLGACSENVHLLADIEKEPGCCGVKIFMGSSTGTLLVENDKDLETAFQTSKKRIALHCEDEKRLNERKRFIIPGDVRSHPVWRDETVCLNATKKAVELAYKHKKHIHILHVTTRQEIEYLKNCKEYVTAECTPQHLTLTAPDCYLRLGTRAQMNPPIRSSEHREALWKGVHEKVVDVIGSDHAPHTLRDKEKMYPETPSGMTGVQTTLPLLLNHCHNKSLSLEKIVELMAENPARLYNIKNKGRIDIGKDADLTLVDLKKKKTITHEWIESRCGWTPFDGMKVTGWPEMVFLKGEIKVREDEVLGTAEGEILKFN